MDSVQIRGFRLGDEPTLHAVFLSAVHLVACEHYDAKQLQAWAPPDLDPQIWAERIQNIRPFVVQQPGGEIVAYADVQDSGYIDHFFVSGHHGRQGIGTLLMNHLHQVALARQTASLSSDVSRAAQSFFADFGFQVIAQREPIVRGVVVPNALMRKTLPGHR